MSYSIVDPDDVVAGRGPHPAASAYDKRISDALGVSAFEVYQVGLPPGAETVRHDHLADGVEDLYVVIDGDGWVVVDDDELPLRPGLFVAVTVGSSRFVRAGERGLTIVAVCAKPR